MAADKETKEKSLDKMTSTELREIAKEIPDITGASGMNKPDLLSAIKEARGIKEDKVKKEDKAKKKGDKAKKSGVPIQDIKKKIREFKVKQNEAQKAKDSKTAAIFRRRISRLKKKTRQVA